MEKLLLIGAGGFGRVVSEHASQVFDCAFVDDGVEIGSIICGVPVIGKISDMQNLYPEYQMLLVSLGNNRLREKIYCSAKEIGFKFPNIIEKNVYISPYAKVGHGCIILNNVVIQNGSSVGNGVILNPGVEIHQDSSIGNNVLIYTNSVIRTYAQIGDRVCIGSNVTISNGVFVPDDSNVENGKALF